MLAPSDQPEPTWASCPNNFIFGYAFLEFHVQAAPLWSRFKTGVQYMNSTRYIKFKNNQETELGQITTYSSLNHCLSTHPDRSFTLYADTPIPSSYSEVLLFLYQKKREDV
jgi:hypothetical protein